MRVSASPVGTGSHNIIGRKRYDMDKSTLYIAYGSNLNIGQMALRCPNAEAVGTGVIADYRLAFKALGSNAFATIEPCEGGTVPVAVWKIGRRDEAALDRYEGVPRHYTKETAEVIMDGGKTVSGLVYVMNLKAVPLLPSEGYFEAVLSGYRSFGLDERVLFDARRRAGNGDASARNALQHYRKMKGLTQAQLADAAGISLKTLQKYESGERDIRRARNDTVLRLARVLEVPPHLL